MCRASKEKTNSFPEQRHWTFFSAISPFEDRTSSLSRLWLRRRIRAPGTRATHAMASSCSSRSQENRSSSDDTSDSMTPVWTQMKLYGRRPTKTDREQNCSCSNRREHVHIVLRKREAALGRLRTANFETHQEMLAWNQQLNKYHAT